MYPPALPNPAKPPTKSFKPLDTAVLPNPNNLAPNAPASNEPAGKAKAPNASPTLFVITFIALEAKLFPASSPALPKEPVKSCPDIKPNMPFIV